MPDTLDTIRETIDRFNERHPGPIIVELWLGLFAWERFKRDAEPYLRVTTDEQIDGDATIHSVTIRVTTTVPPDGIVPMQRCPWCLDGSSHPLSGCFDGLIPVLLPRKEGTE